MLTRRGILGGLVGLAVVPQAARSSNILPSPGLWDRVVRADGLPIGHFTHRFSYTADSYRVEIDAVMQGAGLIYRHRSQEDWRRGWLDRVESQTSFGSLDYELMFQRREGSFWGDVNGVTYNVSGYVIPASFWHRDTTFVQALWSAEDGLVKIFNRSFIGTREEVIGGQLRRLSGYRLIGQINRDLWYDADRVLWRQDFTHHDSHIEIVPYDEV